MAKKNPAVEPKLPATTGPAPVMYELDSDSLLAGGRRKMAIGLLWQPRSSGQPLHAQAKSASVGDTVFDLSVLYAGGAQVGFASKMDAHKDGMMAAATAIPREYVGDTWLAAFVLPVAGDQMQLAWWIVAHRDGLVYEDRLVRNEIEARESLMDLYDAPGWQTVICPPNWQISDAHDIALGYLIRPGTKGAALKSHSPVTVWAPRAIAAAVVIGGVAFGYNYWQNIQEEAARAELARLQEEELRRLEALQVPPWDGMPNLLDSAIACATLINELQVYPPGWLLDPVTCTVTSGTVSVDATWKRQDGTRAKYLYSALDLRGLPVPQFDATLASGSVSRSASIPANDWGKDVAPLDPNEMFTRLVHRFDTLALPLTLTAQVAQPAAPDASGLPNRKIWNYHSIELESSAFPTELISLIGDIPAVVPNTLTYTPSTQTWKLTAFIYHPPITQTS
ncbi:MAG: type 4b pilus protein PilO2 [Rhodobacter sp.]